MRRIPDSAARDILDALCSLVSGDEVLIEREDGACEPIVLVDDFGYRTRELLKNYTLNVGGSKFLLRPRNIKSNDIQSVADTIETE